MHREILAHRNLQDASFWCTQAIFGKKVYAHFISAGLPLARQCRVGECCSVCC